MLAGNGNDLVPCNGVAARTRCCPHVLREEAVAVLQAYAIAGGPIYNAGAVQGR